eukprot:11186978-Lingulodinium_polyedra.AAC.1
MGGAKRSRATGAAQPAPAGRLLGAGGAGGAGGQLPAGAQGRVSNGSAEVLEVPGGLAGLLGRARPLPRRRRRRGRGA